MCGLAHCVSQSVSLCGHHPQDSCIQAAQGTSSLFSDPWQMPGDSPLRDPTTSFISHILTGESPSSLWTPFLGVGLVPGHRTPTGGAWASQQPSRLESRLLRGHVCWALPGQVVVLLSLGIVATSSAGALLGERPQTNRTAPPQPPGQRGRDKTPRDLPGMEMTLWPNAGAPTPDVKHSN